MKLIDQFLSNCRVAPGSVIKLEDHDPAWEGDQSVPKSERKKFSKGVLDGDLELLCKAQELLYASDSWSILLIFQAMDAAGKDSTIKHVMTGVNPQGVSVYSFKKPSAEELGHDFLWRCAKVVPERGRIGIFNRSYYEEVLVVKVHPEILQAQGLPEPRVDKSFWEDRYDSINGFERHLSRSGTVVLKFFLNVSKAEQRKRFLDRLKDPKKHWKFSSADLAERSRWDDYQKAYEDALSATSTKWAPWYVIPADHKWVTRALVAAAIVKAIEGLNLKYPEVTHALETEIEEGKKLLGKDKD